jgi:hypothetical protein
MVPGNLLVMTASRNERYAVLARFPHGKYYRIIIRGLSLEQAQDYLGESLKNANTIWQEVVIKHEEEIEPVPGEKVDHTPAVKIRKWSATFP